MLAWLHPAARRIGDGASNKHNMGRRRFPRQGTRVANKLLLMKVITRWQHAYAAQLMINNSSNQDHISF
jgi:hypothetical protein